MLDSFKFPPDFPPKLPWGGVPGRPKALSEILSYSIREEVKAIADYEYGVIKAREAGDLKTASLLEHIRQEEQHHKDELVKRLQEVRL